MSIERPVDFSEQIAHFQAADEGEEVRQDLCDIAQTLEDAINEQMISIDPTLTKSGQGADAEVVGNELAERLKIEGVLPSGSLNDINTNTTWVLDSSTKTYTDVPYDSPTGFLTTIVSKELVQQFFVRFASTFAYGDGRIWYRSKLVNTWRSWGRITVTEDELTKYVKTITYDGNETTPTSLFDARTPVHFSSYIAQSWITETIKNIQNASSIISFGAPTSTNAAVFGVEKSTLRSFVTSPANNTGANLYAYGNEQSATLKLTSFSKKLYTFGDSITWGRNGDVSSSSADGYRCQNTFASVIQRNLGITAINWGESSQGWLASGDNGRTAYQEITAHNITDGDYFMLAWGVNDRSEIMTGASLDPDKLGAYTDTSGTSLMAEVYKCVNKIYEIKPQCQVILICPWNGSNPQYFHFPKYKFADSTYSALIAELKKFADYYYIPWIGDNCPLNGFGMEGLMGADHVHPSAKGYEFIGNWLSGELGRIIG